MTPPTHTDRDGNRIVLQDGCLYMDVASEEAGSVTLTPRLEALFRAALTATTNGVPQ
ncbi:hypothetical protein ACWFMI_24880 [Nocardiopsis terrae]|uniref:hypothetical protein n=1 Tax=Streptomyces sp. NPDC057554 TaxID=3350538 RepID=UPI00368B72D8